MINFNQAMKNRRTRYDLTAKASVSDKRIEEVLSEAITYVPSAFHSQSSRAVLLLKKEHAAFWDIVKETLRKIVPKDSFAKTQEKINGFAGGYGTVLFYEDSKTVETLQEKFPAYAENFPIWSNQSSGMLQYCVWTALSQEGMGASLQHYNPLIDLEVSQKFNLPKEWKLVAQMPFGCVNGQPSKIEYLPAQGRLKVFGGSQ